MSSELFSFKNQATAIIPDIRAATPLDLLKIIHDYGLVQSYPNLEVALRIFLTLPVTVASGEKSFSKLKIMAVPSLPAPAPVNQSNGCQRRFLSDEQTVAGEVLNLKKWHKV
ncbi:hypothetical protein Zmor_005933 [Zophobas morio]|uniref:HAT C-terminal dimerisation domain-containing protein n=1 Tax=Zophobas morio TaxID=2755281 RepID=A0AA38IWN3_9CUCU|nr:hypothetical protein Zmor_005933 [Zophobas morio]